MIALGSDDLDRLEHRLQRHRLVPGGDLGNSAEMSHLPNHHGVPVTPNV